MRTFTHLFSVVAVGVVLATLPILPSPADQSPSGAVPPSSSQWVANGEVDPAELLEARLARAAERAARGVVMITTTREIEIPEGLFREMVGEDSVTVDVTYSGVVIREDGAIATLIDTVDDAERIVVTLPEGRETEAVEMGRDARTNLAVLKVDAEELETVSFATDTDPRPGHPIVTGGNPFGLSGSVSVGHITGVNRTLLLGDAPMFGILQVSADINPGDPGGPCLDLSGRCIGMVWSALGRTGGEPGPETNDSTLPSPDNWREVLERIVRDIATDQASGGALMGGARGIGFVIPARVVDHVSREILAHGHVRRGVLGVEVTVEEALGQPVLLIDAVAPASPAETAGLQPGDRIVAVGDTRIRSVYDFNEALQFLPPGAELTVTVRRGGEDVRLTVTLGPR